jgi:hypothetical protein
VFRTTFTFLQSGRFDVAFLARVDGATVRAARIVVVEAAPIVPAPPASGRPAAPAPPASAKWM